MNKTDEQNFIKSMERNYKVCEGIGALKVINVIQDKFRQPNGDIHATYDEWTKFMIPYSELPK